MQSPGLPPGGVFLQHTSGKGLLHQVHHVGNGSQGLVRKYAGTPGENPMSATWVTGAWTNRF